MKYLQIERKCGAVIEVTRCIPKENRKTIPKERRRKKTPEDIKKANDQQAKEKIIRKINTNFQPGDIFAVLTYDQKERPSPEQAKKELQKFLARLRRYYRKDGAELKFVCVTEYENKAIHHHIIINNMHSVNGSGSEYISKCWKHENGHGVVRFRSLSEDGFYAKLGEYILKETEDSEGRRQKNEQRYTCSRNLKKPKEKRIRKNIKADQWTGEPKAKDGYHIITDYIYNGFDRFGFPYMHYYMVKDKPKPEDWKDEKPCKVQGKTIKRRRRNNP